jgi:hypothetical protein
MTQPLKPHLSPSRWVSRGNWALGPLIGSFVHVRAMNPTDQATAIILIADMRERGDDGLPKPVYQTTRIGAADFVAEDALDALQLMMRNVRREMLKQALWARADAEWQSSSHNEPWPH